MRAGLLDRLEKDFRVFADAGSVLIGVSGGPDSMALLRLALLWAEAPGRPRIVAATVDHGLRPDSAAEAAQVANWCAALGVPHRVLCWEGEKPAARIQERARDARYRLLVDHTGVEGCDTLFTAHHMDDQAETVLIRMARGSGVSGLAAMRPVVLREGVRHGRPLLGWRKEELIRICAESGQPYFTDPSNANPRYARTRLRTLAPTLADGLAVSRVGELMLAFCRNSPTAPRAQMTRFSLWPRSFWMKLRWQRRLPKSGSTARACWKRPQKSLFACSRAASPASARLNIAFGSSGWSALRAS